MILEKNGNVKIWRIMKAAKKTIAHEITARSSPAKVKIWFKTGRAGASVWKICPSPFITERKSFLAIQIIKSTKKRFPQEMMNRSGSFAMIL